VTQSYVISALRKLLSFARRIRRRRLRPHAGGIPDEKRDQRCVGTLKKRHGVPPLGKNILWCDGRNRLTKVSEIRTGFKVIMSVAGGPGDRWSGHRKMVGREESPDTVLSHQEKWATRLVTPGERLGWHRLGLCRPIHSRKVPQKMYRRRNGTVASRRKTCETSSNSSFRLARVKRWGKSPPLVWQHTRQGKPRVVQGQIGGESRPGSSSQCSGSNRFTAVAALNALPLRRRRPPQRATLG
jgi:hypothetical protein